MRLRLLSNTSMNIQDSLKAASKKKEDRTAYIKSNEKLQRKAIFITQMGGVVNIFLAGCKGIVGLTLGSTALIGDAANSLGDIICDGIVYYSLVRAASYSYFLVRNPL